MKKIILLLAVALFSLQGYAQTIIGGASELQVRGGSPNSVSSIRWFKKNRPTQSVDTTSWAHYSFVGTLAAGSRWAKQGTVSTGFKVYSAIITQTSTNAPTVTVLNAADGNYLGAVTWTYTSAGLYLGTFAGTPLVSGKTFVTFDTPFDPASTTAITVREGAYASTSTVTVATSNINIAVPAVAATNALLSGTLIQIVVFD